MVLSRRAGTFLLFIASSVPAYFSGQLLLSVPLLADMAFGNSKLPQSPAQGSGRTMFQLIGNIHPVNRYCYIKKITPKLSGIKQLSLMLMESMDQGFRQGMAGLAVLCSTMSGVSAGILVCLDYHNKIP